MTDEKKLSLKQIMEIQDGERFWEELEKHFHLVSDQDFLEALRSVNPILDHLPFIESSESNQK